MFNYIKELRKTERGKIIFKLTLYMIFFIIVFVLVFVSSKINNNPSNYRSSSKESIKESNVSKIKTYLEKQENLLIGNYSYTYIVEGIVNVIYTGEYSKGISEGFKETKDGIIKYRKENDIVSQEKMGIYESYEDLFKDLDSSLFDFKNLFVKLNSEKTMIENKNSQKIYKYELVDYNYEIVTDSDYINQITISNQEIKYTFSFEY